MGRPGRRSKQRYRSPDLNVSESIATEPRLMSLRRVFLGISLTSLSVLMLELALTRLFSATMYYHFAFMAISLALFGSGASGVFIYLLRNRFQKHIETWLTAASTLFALSSIFALYVII